MAVGAGLRVVAAGAGLVARQAVAVVVHGAEGEAGVGLAFFAGATERGGRRFGVAGFVAEAAELVAAVGIALVAGDLEHDGGSLSVAAAGGAVAKEAPEMDAARGVLREAGHAV